MDCSSEELFSDILTTRVGHCHSYQKVVDITQKCVESFELLQADT